MSEIAVESTVEGGAEAPEPQAAPAVASEATPSAESAAPPWADSPEFFQAVSQASEQYLTGLAQQGYQEVPQSELPQIDPFADDFASQMAARDEALISRVTEQLQQTIQPVVGWTQQQQAEQAKGQVYETFKGFADLGEFDQDEAFSRLRHELLPQYVQQFGDNPRVEQMAIRKAAEAQAAKEKAVADRAIEAYKTSLQTVAGAPSEPGAAGAGTQEAPVPKSIMEAWQQFKARRAQEAAGGGQI